MGAADEIRAAIEKLTVLRSVDLMYPDQYPGDTDAAFRAACGLIATLHRTIDAQLAILQGVSTRPASTLDMREYDVQALALARAINGGSK